MQCQAGVALLTFLPSLSCTLVSSLPLNDAAFSRAFSFLRLLRVDSCFPFFFMAGAGPDTGGGAPVFAVTVSADGSLVNPCVCRATRDESCSFTVGRPAGSRGFAAGCGSFKSVRHMQDARPGLHTFCWRHRLSFLSANCGGKLESLLRFGNLGIEWDGQTRDC